jgi:signal transduction histidine kinase
MSISQLHHIDWDQVGKGFAALRRQGLAQYESTLHTADGRVVTVEVHARPIEFAAADSILWTLHDLTERKQLDELRQNLSAMIYHDLRSPLSNLTSSLSLLKGMVGADPDIGSAMEIAEHSTERMNRLVNSLLDIDRLEAGNPLTSQAANRPEELVQLAVRDVGSLAESRKREIRMAIAPGLPEIWIDGDMIRRVLINLLENAFKFSRAGSPVEIGVVREGDFLQFWVQDHGPGIPAEDQQRVFQKFARRTREGASASGLGLGLAFCEMAVQAHQGSIRVESQEGKGSRFIFTLPVKAAGI